MPRSYQLIYYYLVLSTDILVFKHQNPLEVPINSVRITFFILIIIFPILVCLVLIFLLFLHAHHSNNFLFLIFFEDYHISSVIPQYFMNPTLISYIFNLILQTHLILNWIPWVFSFIHNFYSIFQAFLSYHLVLRIFNYIEQLYYLSLSFLVHSFLVALSLKEHPFLVNEDCSLHLKDSFRSSIQTSLPQETFLFLDYSMAFLVS